MQENFMNKLKILNNNYLKNKIDFKDKISVKELYRKKNKFIIWMNNKINLIIIKYKN